eukprot:scaffold115146_cov84-Cyclotella_meneghiniana.AAC.1
MALWPSLPLAPIDTKGFRGDFNPAPGTLEGTGTGWSVRSAASSPDLNGVLGRPTETGGAVIEGQEASDIAAAPATEAPLRSNAAAKPRRVAGDPIAVGSTKPVPMKPVAGVVKPAAILETPRARVVPDKKE